MEAVSTPTKIKAEAIALHVMGLSSRDIVKQLRAKFPDARVPAHCTVNKWVRPGPRTIRRRWEIAAACWAEVALLAGELVMERSAALEKMSHKDVVLAYSRAMELAAQTSEGYRWQRFDPRVRRAVLGTRGGQ